MSAGKVRNDSTDRASGPLTSAKNVSDSVEFWVTAGPRTSQTSDQRVGGSSPSGRALNGK